MAPAYTHGHHPSVLSAHRWRTVDNSAAYLAGHLRPGMSVLDVGCGPGTITAGLAERVAPGRVVAADAAETVLDEARANTAGLDNVEFAVADVHALDFPDGTFDVVHAHQVLQHVADPVGALREMRRVTRPGGIVAARDVDYAPSPGIRSRPRWPPGCRCTTPSPAATAASPTRAAGWSPGPAPPGSPTSPRPRRPGASPRRGRAWWGGVGRTGSRRRSPSKPSSAVSPPARNSSGSTRAGRRGPPPTTAGSPSPTARSSAAPAPRRASAPRAGGIPVRPGPEPGRVRSRPGACAGAATVRRAAARARARRRPRRARARCGTRPRRAGRPRRPPRCPPRGSRRRRRRRPRPGAGAGSGP